MFPRPRSAARRPIRRAFAAAAALLAIALGAVVPGPARAQRPDWSQSARAGLQVSVATRIDSSGAETKLLQVSLPYRSLVFTRRGDSFRSGVLVTAVARRDGRRVGGGVGRAEATAADYAATRAEARLECAVPLNLRGRGPAELDVTVTVDETSRRWRERVRLRAGQGLRVPVYFADFRWNLGEAGAPALGGGRDTLMARLTLGRRPNIAQWPADGVTLAARVRPSASDRDAVARRLPVAPVPVGQAPPAVDLAWAAADLPFGHLVLTVWLESGGGDEPERLDLDPPRRFTNLHVRFADDGEWRQHVAWLEGRADGDRRRELLRAAPGERRAAWRAFWAAQAARDGAPGATELELGHLRRVVEADDRFGGFGRGALTDRGRTWIRYGPPDAVEQRGDDLSTEARWEVWYYHDLRLVFTFFDPHGLGDYRLAGSGSL